MTKLDNPIEQYIANNKNPESESATVLFKGKDENMSQMTELNSFQIEASNALLQNDQYLSEFGIKPIFTDYVVRNFKLLVSKDRKSRQEYVQVQKAEEERQRLMQDMRGMGGLP